MKNQKLAVSLYMGIKDELYLEFLPDEDTSTMTKAELLEISELNTILIPASRVKDFCTLAGLTTKQQSRLNNGFYVNMSIVMSDVLFHMI